MNDSGEIAAGALMLQRFRVPVNGSTQGGLIFLDPFLPGLPSEAALGINNYGALVGGGGLEPGNGRAFIYEESTVEDLNALIPSDSNWILNSAVDINDLGQIAGLGVLSVDVGLPGAAFMQAAFLLSPVNSDNEGLSLKLTAPVWEADGTLSFNIVAEPGTKVIIEESNDLRSWRFVLRTGMIAPEMNQKIAGGSSGRLFLRAIASR
jgi:hypothetical protein